MSARQNIDGGRPERSRAAQSSTAATRRKVPVPARPSPEDRGRLQRPPAMLREQSRPAIDEEAVSRCGRRLYRRLVQAPWRYDGSARFQMKDAVYSKQLP